MSNFDFNVECTEIAPQYEIYFCTIYMNNRNLVHVCLDNINNHIHAHQYIN